MPNKNCEVCGTPVIGTDCRVCNSPKSDKPSQGDKPK